MLSRRLRSLVRLCLLPCCILGALGCSPSWSAQFSSKYDAEIHQSVAKYWPDLPVWRLWKAQLYQESRLDPNVCSQVGACGLAQFMSPTWNDVIHQLRWDRAASRFDAKMAIGAGAFYQAKLRGSWRPQGRTAFDRNDLGLASYNAGLGNVIKSQAVCNDAVLWADIAPCMEKITGDHAKETLGYVVSIRKWWGMMEMDK